MLENTGLNPCFCLWKSIFKYLKKTLDKWTHRSYYMGRGKRNMNQYQSWQAFTFRGKKFLCLTFKGGAKSLIIGEGMQNYGTWFDAFSFKKFYESHPEEEMSLGTF